MFIKVNNIYLKSFHIIDSTNSYLQKHINEIPNNTIVIANKQNKGRGRGSNQWISPSGNLYLSFILKNAFYNSKIFGKIPLKLYPISIAKSIHQNLIKNFRINKNLLKLKWPNDIYYILDNIPYKLAGILTEIHENTIITGIGINLNTTPKITKQQYKAISLKEITKQKIKHKVKLAYKIVQNINRTLNKIKQQENFTESINYFNKHLLFKNQKTNIYTLDTKQNIIPLYITYNGELTVEKENGEKYILKW